MHKIIYRVYKGRTRKLTYGEKYAAKRLQKRLIDHPHLLEKDSKTKIGLMIKIWRSGSINRLLLKKKKINTIKHSAKNG